MKCEQERERKWEQERDQQWERPRLTAQTRTNNQDNNNDVASQTQQIKTNTNLQCCNAPTQKDDNEHQNAPSDTKMRRKTMLREGREKKEQKKEIT